MRNTKIEWADMTWNPISGCYGDCPYCYARQIANRFQFRRDCILTACDGSPLDSSKDLHIREDALNRRRVIELDRAAYLENTTTEERAAAPYPFGFTPTFRRDRLEELTHIQGSYKDIFVCSMADLLAPWVPDSCIEEVFDACESNPNHRYFFLTKHPERYTQYGVPALKNMWYGTSITRESEMSRFNCLPAFCNTFVSMEPILEDLRPENHDILFRQVDWIILGAETGRRKNKVAPQKQWIDKIVKQAVDTPNGPFLFMKDSLLPAMGEKGMWRSIPPRWYSLRHSEVQEHE